MLLVTFVTCKIEILKPWRPVINADAGVLVKKPLTMETIVQQDPYSTQQVNLLTGLRHTLEKSVLRRSLTKFPWHLFSPSWKDGLSTRQCSPEKFLSLSWNNLICSTKLLHSLLLHTATIKYSENISTHKIFLHGFSYRLQISINVKWN